MNDKIQKQLETFRLMSNEGKELHKFLIKLYDKRKIQHVVLLISLSRVIKYFDSYIILVEKKYTEPASDLIRSMYHTLLWMRWSLISIENAEVYFYVGREESKKMVNRLLQMKIIDIKGAPDPKKVLELIKEQIKNYSIPKVSKQVEDIGYGDTHNLIYPILAAISHGSINLLKEDNSYSYEPDDEYMEMFFEVANNVFTDCLYVAKNFIQEEKIRPVPDILKLTGLKKG